MHDDDRFAGGRAVFLPIDPMLGKSRRSQMARPDEGWVRRLAVWRGGLGACIHGNYFCDKWEIGCKCHRARASPSLRQHHGRCRFIVQLDAHPAFCRSLRKLQDPDALLRLGLSRRTEPGKGKIA
jgi:hypothetical protein